MARRILWPASILIGAVALGILITGSDGEIPSERTASSERGEAPADSCCAGLEEPEVPAAGLLSILGKVPEFRFQNQDGEPFGLDDLLGHVWVADFIYIKCQGPCPAMTVDMKKLQDLTEDIPGLRLVTFTVDPERDTVEDLKSYAQNTDADPERWTFLRGEVKDLKRVMIDGFKMGDPNNPLNHSTRFCLVDQTGRVRGYYDHRRGDEMVRLRKHIRLLLTGKRS